MTQHGVSTRYSPLWLSRAKDTTKDQSYVIWMVNKSILERLTLPNGHLLKSEIRQIAQDNQLPTTHTPDSIELCFSGPQEAKQRVTLTSARVINQQGKTLKLPSRRRP